MHVTHVVITLLAALANAYAASDGRLKIRVEGPVLVSTGQNSVPATSTATGR